MRIGRCKLYHNALGVVVNRILEFLCTVPDHDCACRHTEAHCPQFTQFAPASGLFHAVETVISSELRYAKSIAPNILYLRAHPHAISAENALDASWIIDSDESSISVLLFGVF